MIPVFEPQIGEEEISYVTDALKKGEISGTFGSYITDFEQQFAEYIGVKHGISVTSGTTALHLAVAALGLNPDDEVLVSASTNIASVLAVIHNNAIPVPVDSESDTWNLDLELIEKLITPKTKAIIAVHLFGHPIDSIKLREICKKHKLVLIEDCAESHGATSHGIMTGSYGELSCFSFYANKLITTGEGGMVLTNNDDYAEKIKLLRNLAFIKPRFYHQVAGYNFRMTGYQAAMGLAQLKKLNHFIEEKRRVANSYNNHLSGIKGIQTPVEKESARHVYWMYGILLNNEFGITRDQLTERLFKAGIETRTFFCPMNLQPCVKEVKGYREINCPVAENLWNNGMYLPSSVSLNEEQISFICSTIEQISKNL